MKSIKVAVLCGGISSEREVSIMSGESVFQHLDRSKFDPALIEITQDLKWVDRHTGQQYDWLNFGKELLFDLCFNVVHGDFGEDGKLQSILDIHKIPYTHSGVLASALSMDKQRLSQVLELAQWPELHFPKSFLLQDSNFESLEKLDKFVGEAGLPLILKPSRGGSSVDTHKVNSIEDLRKLVRTQPKEDIWLVQEFIAGREFTCPVFKNSTGELILDLDPGEILIGEEIFDYGVKYSDDNASQEVFPVPNASTELISKIKLVSQKIHDLIGADGLSRSDFRYTADGKLYFLEINTNPGLTSASLCPKSAAAQGITYQQLLDLIVQAALDKKWN
ncbi:MAG: D-alanine--D-alanine ligase [Patescibacteria group bacterium]